MTTSLRLRYALFPLLLPLLVAAGATVGACSSAESSVSGDAGGDGGGTSDGHAQAKDSQPDVPVVCGYPPVANDPACPKAYTYNSHAPCSPIGLNCSYPGAGDGTANGCYATAEMFCRGDVDSGADATGNGDAGGTGYWLSAQ